MRKFLTTMLLTVAIAGGLLAQSDDRIYDTVRIKLANDPDVKGGALEVEVKDGVVTLKGNLPTPKSKEKAERLTKKIKGVKSVTNRIEVSPFTQGTKPE